MYECICGVHETVSQFISDYHCILKVPIPMYIVIIIPILKVLVPISNLINKKKKTFYLNLFRHNHQIPNSFSRLIKFEVRMKNKAEMKETGRSEMKKQE